MTLIEGILVVLFGLGVVYFVFYIFGLLFVRYESDLKILHRWQKLPIWGPLALKKLNGIYRKQLDECSSSEDAHRISVATRNILPYVSQRASMVEDNLLIDEMRISIEEARDDEEKLLKLFGPIRAASSRGSYLRDGELFSLFWIALRPFTEKRIHEATTVDGLVSLTKESVLQSCGCCTEEFDRIKKSIKPLYESKLKKLVLQEAIAASKKDEANNACFRVDCEDGDIDALVAMKRNHLWLKFEQYPFWSSDELLSEINLALLKFLEQQK